MTIRTHLAALTLASLAQPALLARVVQAPSSHGSSAHSSFVETWTPRNTFERSADFARDPIPQIRAHLQRVVDELDAREVDTLAPELRTRRAAHLERLEAYAAAGVFPTNEHTPVPTPIFIDREGRACAVAHLMIESGARELAERIAARENTDYVSEIEQIGAADWIASSGLTAEECALIQPASSPCGFGSTIQSIELCRPAVRNSSGLPAIMNACGSATASSNTVWIPIESLPPNTMGLLLNSLHATFVATPGGSQGNLCLGNPVGRYTSSVFTATPTGHAMLSLDLTQTPTPHGAVSIVAGDTWYFQCWFRDGASSNFSNAIGIAFQ
jgi:hypothetical protein